MIHAFVKGFMTPGMWEMFGTFVGATVGILIVCLVVAVPIFIIVFKGDRFL